MQALKMVHSVSYSAIRSKSCQIPLTRHSSDDWKLSSHCPALEAGTYFTWEAQRQHSTLSPEDGRS
jgi:hypothetical protein